MSLHVRLKPGPHRTVSPAPGADGGGFDGTERTGTRSDGHKQGRNSANGCGEDRALVSDKCRRLIICARGKFSSYLSDLFRLVK